MTLTFRYVSKKLKDLSIEMIDSEKQQCISRNIFFYDNLIRFSHFEQISLKKPELFADKLILSMFHRFIKTAFHKIYQYDPANNQLLDFEEMINQSSDIIMHSTGEDSETSLPNSLYLSPTGRRVVVYLTDFPSPSSGQFSSQSTTPEEDPGSTSGMPQNIEASSLGDCHTQKVSSLRIVVIINAWGFYWLLAPGKKNESIKLFRTPRTAEIYMKTQPASFYLPVLAEQAAYALQPEPTEITGPVRRQLQF